ncbi:hypothetical protein LshimejAT787_0704140 [Lyophyllum shimeji]|uniref:Uncharacterized protein n=1 Tax=Lyophyllum shimeji TaxID=47721 RepID=A0A9P3PQU2_LYOSH|nr:hypothetical protein LshimejAT787_0704140 [Lyophyllum shimeji]
MIRNFRLWTVRKALDLTQPAKLAPLLSQLGPCVETLEIGVATLPPSLIDIMADKLPNLKSSSVNGHLSSYHLGEATTHAIQTQLNSSIRIAGAGTPLNLDVLSFGVQIESDVPNGTPEHENVVLDLLEQFSSDYNSTPSNQFVTDVACSKLTWNRLDTRNRRPEVPGQLSIEHVEHIKPVFRTF